MTRLLPMDVLAVGTQVNVNGKRGTVQSVDEFRDQHGAPIMVHTVKLTERFHHRVANRAVYVPIDPPMVYPVNYSAIQY